MVWSDGTTMWAADPSGWVFALLLATEARDSAQDKDNRDKDTQDKDNRDSSGNNHASRVRSDGAVIQMADRGDSMLYVYELPTKAAMESMDPTWADIRIFKLSGLDLPVRAPSTLTLTRVTTVARYSGARVSITAQYANSSAASHGVTGQPGTANVRGMYDSSGGGSSRSGGSGTEYDDPSTRSYASTCLATHPAGAGMRER